MSGLRIFAFVLVIAGGLALAYGGFTYTKDSHTAELGPLSFTVKEKERVNVPMWAGLGAVIVGGVLLVMGGGRRR
jgi:TRAP-type C4-dicarboxylate transport system permease small subunit